MEISIFAGIAVSVVIILQAIFDYLKPKKGNKYIWNTLKFLIPTIGVIGIWLGVWADNKQEQELYDKLSEAKAERDSLIKLEYFHSEKIDSLQSNNIDLRFQNIDLQSRVSELKSIVKEGFKSTHESIDDAISSSGARLLNYDNRSRLTQSLNNTTGIILIEKHGASQERDALADQLKLIFESAGWQVGIANTSTGNNLKGILIHPRSIEVNKDITVLLKKIFDSQNIEANIDNFRSPDKGDFIHIKIGAL